VAALQSAIARQTVEAEVLAAVVVVIASGIEASAAAAVREVAVVSVAEDLVEVVLDPAVVEDLPVWVAVVLVVVPAAAAAVALAEAAADAGAVAVAAEAAAAEDSANTKRIQRHSEQEKSHEVNTIQSKSRKVLMRNLHCRHLVFAP
jgi:hypothetical protein